MPKSTLKSVPVGIWILEGAFVAVCIGLIVFGGLNTETNLGLVSLATGALGLVIIGSSLMAVCMLSDRVGAGPTDPRQSGGIESMEALLSRIHENSMLSDTAKRVLFRDRELDMLRRAIEDDIAHGDYNAGMALCDDMANVFGHREEAEAFRTRIQQAGQAAYDAKVLRAIEEFEVVLRSRDWGRAHHEAARIRRLYPNHHQVLELDHRILRAREEHMTAVEARFLEAANRDDVEAAMPLLKELDRYLAPEEATRLAQAAQNVVIKHRDNLSMQFRLAVSDHRWAEAARIGDAITQEYPNTKMAEEVRSLIDVLRTRATQAAVAAEG